MSISLLFPYLQVALCLGAAVVYFCRGNVLHGIYWALAGAITLTVTFMGGSK